MTKKKKRRNVSYKDYLTEDGLIKLEGMARDGLINEQIAHNIGIAEGTLYSWMKDYVEIAEALKRGKEVIDRQVENALLKRALGYEYEEEKIIREKDGKGRDVIKREVYKRKAQPDTTAQIFWLKNRKPAEWRDRHNIEHSGNIDIIQRAKEIEERLFGDE